MLIEESVCNEIEIENVRLNLILLVPNDHLADSAIEKPL